MSIPMRMQQRRGTAAQWSSVNPVLAEGEIGYERGTGRFKVGDGTSQWNDLGYSSMGSTIDIPAAFIGAEIDRAGSPAEEAVLARIAQPVDPTLAGYDIVLLAGQSNMSGRGQGLDTTRYDPPDPRIQQVPTAGPYKGRIMQAFEPLQQHDIVTDPSVGIGPGMTFARNYIETLAPGRKVLLVPSAYGATGFSTAAPLTWDQAKSTPNLYDDAIRATITALMLAGPNSRVAAILWLQGEYDNGMSGSAYAAKLDQLIAGFRAVFGGDVPFVLGRMVPEFVAASSGNAAIDAVHQATPQRVAYTAVATGLAYSTYDNLHYDGAGARAMGREMFFALGAAQDHASAGAMVPGRIPALSAAAPDSNTLALSWQAPATHGSAITGYSILRGPTPWSLAQIATVGPEVRTYSAIGSQQATHFYAVAAINAIGTGPQSPVQTKAGLVIEAPSPSPGGAYSGPALTSSDNYNRADSTINLGSTSTGGVVWTVAAGVWGISSNKAYCSTVVPNSIALVESGRANARFGAVVTQSAGGTMTGEAGLIGRWVDANNFLLITSQGELFSKVAGTFTSQGGTTGGWQSGDRMDVEVEGTTVRLYRNGSLAYTWTGVTAASTGTKHGLRVHNAAGNYRFDDWSCGAIPAAVIGPASDNFNRADSTTSLGVTSTGAQPWQALIGTWGISNNKARLESGTGNCIAVLDAGAPSASIQAAITGASANCGIAARVVDGANYLLFAGGGGWFECVGGAFTSLPWTTGGSGVLASGDVVKVSASGTTLTVSKNGSAVGTLATNRFQTATKFGLRQNGVDSNLYDDVVLTVP